MDLNIIKNDTFGRITGVLALNKPASITSHDLVDDVRAILNIQKVGHCGTLDPFATGLMILLVGKSTSLSANFLNCEKEYEFEILVGVSTTTQDITGELVKQVDVENLEENLLNKAAKTVTKSKRQFTPVYSSVKVSGFRLRELAYNSSSIRNITEQKVEFSIKKDSRLLKKLIRKNMLTEDNKVVVDLPERVIEIKDFKMENPIEINPSKLDERITTKHAVLIKAKAHVSKGTYIRQIADDIGKQLNLPATLYSLTRTRVGDIHLKDALTIDELASKYKNFIPSIKK